MNDYRLAPGEAKFADLIWANEPIASPELVKLSEKEMQWKKSTTYTVLKKLCNKGIFKNDNALVSSLLTRDTFYARQSRRYVEETFGGSLPKFLTTFFNGGSLTDEQVDEIKRLIDGHRES